MLATKQLLPLVSAGDEFAISKGKSDPGLTIAASLYSQHPP